MTNELNTMTESFPTTQIAKCRFLLVEDNADAADSTAMLLQLWGHEVYIADDGERAVEIATELKPDIALLDIGLPALNGFEVAQHLRSRPETANSVIIAVTGYNRPEHRAHARQFGFDYYFHKPADMSCFQNIPGGVSLRDAIAARLKSHPELSV